MIIAMNIINKVNDDKNNNLKRKAGKSFESISNSKKNVTWMGSYR